MQKSPILMWFRRDLRLGDHAALTAAAQSGHPVIPVFIYDEVVATHGAAPLVRLGLSVEALDKSLREKSSCPRCRQDCSWQAKDERKRQGLQDPTLPDAGMTSR